MGQYQFPGTRVLGKLSHFNRVHMVVANRDVVQFADKLKSKLLATLVTPRSCLPTEYLIMAV